MSLPFSPYLSQILTKLLENLTSLQGIKILIHLCNLREVILVSFGTINFTTKHWSQPVWTCFFFGLWTNYSCGQANTLNLVTHLWKVWHVPKPRKKTFNIEAWSQFIDLYEWNRNIWTFGEKVIKNFGTWEKRQWILTNSFLGRSRWAESVPTKLKNSVKWLPHKKIQKNASRRPNKEENNLH